MGSPSDAERLVFWKSAQHEIDFVTSDGAFIDVKWGSAGPRDFSWFARFFSQDQRLLVVSQSEFGTQQVRVGSRRISFCCRGGKSVAFLRGGSLGGAARGGPPLFLLTAPDHEQCSVDFKSAPRATRSSKTKQEPW